MAALGGCDDLVGQMQALSLGQEPSTPDMPKNRYLQEVARCMHAHVVPPLGDFVANYLCAFSIKVEGLSGVFGRIAALFRSGEELYLDSCKLTNKRFTALARPYLEAKSPRSYFVVRVNGSHYYDGVSFVSMADSEQSKLVGSRVGKVEFFVTQGELQLTSFASCQQQTGTYLKQRRFVLANSLENTASVQGARLRILDSDKTTETDFLYYMQLLLHDNPGEERGLAMLRAFITRGDSKKPEDVARGLLRLGKVDKCFEENFYVQALLGELFSKGTALIPQDPRRAQVHFAKSNK